MCYDCFSEGDKTIFEGKVWGESVMAVHSWSQCYKNIFKGGVWGYNDTMAVQGLLQHFKTFFKGIQYDAR